MTPWDSENTTAPHTARDGGALPQINIRAPEAARPVLIRLAQIIRRNPDFIEALDAMLNGRDEEGLTERVMRLERQVVSLAARPNPGASND